jgi:PAS domain S-box-containing protein
MEKQLTSAITWDLLDSLNEGIVVATTEGVIQYINKPAQHLLGLETNPLSLTDIFQVIAPAENSQLLLDAGYEVSLPMDDVSIKFQSKIWHGSEQDLLSITITKIPNKNLEPAIFIEHLTALTDISNESDFDRKLQLIVNSLQSSGWGRVVLSLRDRDFKPTKTIRAGFTDVEQQHLNQKRLSPEIWLELLNDEKYAGFRRGICYFVPEESNWVQEHAAQAILPDQKAFNTDSTRWHPKDILSVPLYDRQQHLIGLIGLDRPFNGRRPTHQTIQTIEVYAQFAASAIENAQLVSEAIGRNQGLELLAAASQAISSTLDKDSVLSLLGQYMLQVVNATGYTIYQWQEVDQTLTILDNHTKKTPSHTEGKVGTIFQVADQSWLSKITVDEQIFTQNVTATAPKIIYQPSWLAEDYLTILIPITLSGELFGIIQLFLDHHPQSITTDELQLLIALSNQASAALETALIFEDTYERERFYTALGSVTLAINYTLNLESVLNLICSESQRLFNVDGAYIWQRTAEGFVGGAVSGHGAEEFINKKVPLEDSQAFASLVSQRGESIFINNIPAHDDVYLELPEKETILAALGVPLEQEGEIIGILILIDRNNPFRFSNKDLTQASLLGVQAAIALQNAKLFEELRQLNEDLDARVARRTVALNEESNRVKILLRITNELSASLDQDRVLNQALQLVNEVVNATRGAILLIDQESGELVFRASFGDERSLPFAGLRSGLMRDEGLAGWIISNRSSVIVHDTMNDPRWVERATSSDLRSVLAVPLISNEEVIGTLMLFHIHPHAFTIQQLDLVEAAANQVANAINNANLYLLIRDQAERLGTLLRVEQVEAAKNQAILESIADGVLVADARSEITLINRAITTILGVPRESLIGKSVNELLGLYGQSAESWTSTIEDWAKNADLIEQWTVLADRLTVEDKVISVHLSPVFVGNSFFGTVSIFRDITKEVEVDRLKSEFVSTVSHELRTPMTSIKGYADLMLMGVAGQLSDRQQQHLQVIKSNADRLHNLVNDLLDISRIETGKTKLDLRPLDVPQMIQQVIGGHVHGRLQHEKRHLNIKTEISSSLPLVNADQAAITQILTNLLDNAINYTPDGGTIMVHSHAAHNYVYISIEDSGIGISEENKAKIFDRFFRAEDETVQKVRGTGLGLAIVRSFIEMHGGILKVDSIPNVGSTFTFNLPIVVEDGDDPV